MAFEEILIQPLWENHLIGNKKNKVWFQRGIQFLSDIVDENGDILAFENFKQKFRLEEHITFLIQGFMRNCLMKRLSKNRNKGKERLVI